MSAVEPRCVFLGSETWACRSLECVLEHCKDVVVYCEPSSKPPAFAEPFGDSVAEYAAERELTVIEHGSPDGEAALREALSRPATCLISSNWRRRIAEDALGAAELGAFNVHGSLLPKYRGTAPIVAALADGEGTLGLTLHEMVEEYDAGAIVGQVEFEVDRDERVVEALFRAFETMTELFDRFFAALSTGLLRRREQDATLATWTRPLDSEFRSLDFAWTAAQVHDRVRALSFPYDGALLVGQVDANAAASRRGLHSSSPSAVRGDWVSYTVGASRVLDEHDQSPAGRVLRIEDSGLVVSCGGTNPVWVGEIVDAPKQAASLAMFRSASLRTSRNRS